jgi:predicted nucleotidyltransferase
MATQFEQVAGILAGHQVKFIVIGGWAAIFHGLARSTMDVDVVYARDRENIRRLVEALDSLNPYLRGAPPGLPFSWDEKTIRNGLNFTLTTSLGDLDLLGEVAGGGGYEKLLPHTIEMEAHGVKYRCVTLERLIQLKRAAGRPKDLEVIAELQALLDERDRKS